MGVSQDSNGFQTSLVSDYMQFLWIISRSCPLETSPCSGCMWEAVKEKERKKQLRVRFPKGCRGGAPHRCRVCPLNSARFITKINHRPEDFRGVQNLRFSISEFDVRSWRYSYPHWVD